MRRVSTQPADEQISLKLDAHALANLHSHVDMRDPDKKLEISN